MDPKFQTSFIPKQEVSFTNRRPLDESRFNIFSITAVSFLAISIILAISVFIYHRSLINQINKMNAELVAAKASFEPGFIKELVKTDKRIESAKILLNKHSVITPVFSMLEKNTLQGVRFTRLNFILDAKDIPSLELRGEARSFQSVALQSDVFNAESIIKNPSFTSINLNESGLVEFNFKGGLDQPALLFKSNVIKREPSNNPQVEVLPSDSDSDVLIQDLPDIP